jgi:hypothetical protein
MVVSLDYRHEFRSVMDAHVVHADRVDAPVAVAPIPEQTTPDAVARRTIRLHVVAGGFTLLALVLGVNLTLSRLVLTPIARVGTGIERLQRGLPTDGSGEASADEMRDVGQRSTIWISRSMPSWCTPFTPNASQRWRCSRRASEQARRVDAL